jgi:hypothetical protein
MRRQRQIELIRALEFRTDELKDISIVPTGTRLERGVLFKQPRKWSLTKKSRCAPAFLRAPPRAKVMYRPC